MAGPKVTAVFAADISQFRQSLAQATTMVTAFDRTTTQVGRQLSNFGNQFSGAKVHREAEVMARAIQDIGGASRLTASELQRIAPTINEAIAKYRALGTEAPAAVRQLATELKHLNAESAKIGANVAGVGGRLSGGLSSILGGLGIGVGAGLGIGALTAASTAIGEMATEGARLAPLQQSFARLSGGAMQAQASLLNLRVATKGLVSEADLLQAANKGALLGLGQMGIQFDEVARIATVLGRAMGEDAAKSVDDLTTALSRMSPQILDNLGIKVDLSAATEAYAKSVGKSVTALTEEEKKLAFARAAMEAARTKAKELGEIQLTVAEQAERIAKAFGDMGAEAFAAGNQSRGLAGFLGDIADALDRIRNAGGIGFGLRAAADSAGRYLTEKFGPLTNMGAGNAARTAVLGPAGIYPFLANAVGSGLQWAAGMTPADQMKLAGVPSALMPSHGGAVTGKSGASPLAPPSAEELAALKRWREEIEELTGAKLVAAGTRLAKQLRDIAAAGKSIASDNVEELAQRLMRSREAADKSSAAFRQMGDALNTLEIKSRRIDGLNPLFIQSSIDSAARNAITTAQRTTGDYAGFTGLINSTNPLSFAGLAPTINGTRVKISEAKKETRDWAAAAQDVAQAFGTLSQISGGKLDPISSVIGKIAGAMNAGQQLAKSFGLTGTAGNLTATGIAAGTLGFSAGQEAIMSGGSRWGAVGRGAASGAASGVAYGGAGAVIGAGIGAVTSYFGARNAESELRKLKDIQANQLVAQYGSLDALLDTVGGLGLNQQSFLEKFYGDPKEFAQAVGELTAALTREQLEANKLAKGLQAVAAAEGVLSKAQLLAISKVRPGGPAAEAVLQFAQQQREQAESGIVRAIAALTPSLSDQEAADLTKGVDDPAERARIIEAELARRSRDTLANFSLGAKGAASGLFVAFTEAVRQGESAVAVLKRLKTPIEDLKKLYERAGLKPGAGFEQLGVLSGIATGAQTGPAVELAAGLGQALAGFANTGLLSPELFGELANGIGEAYHQLELLGKGGLEAARLMQPGLQSIWQLIQDNPALRNELDDTTLALLDFAEQAGLIGEDFRPAADLMLDAIGDLIEKIGDLIERIGGIPGIDVPVTYTPTQPGAPGGDAPPGFTPPNGGDYTTALASGGVVTRPTRALIGEAGPEAVIPLSRLRGGGARAITIVNVTQLDGREITRVVNRYQGDERRLMGVA